MVLLQLRLLFFILFLNYQSFAEYTNPNGVQSSAICKIMHIQNNFGLPKPLLDSFERNVTIYVNRDNSLLNGSANVVYQTFVSFSSCTIEEMDLVASDDSLFSHRKDDMEILCESPMEGMLTETEEHLHIVFMTLQRLKDAHVICPFFKNVILIRYVLGYDYALLINLRINNQDIIFPVSNPFHLSAVKHITLTIGEALKFALYTLRTDLPKVKAKIIKTRSRESELKSMRNDILIWSSTALFVFFLIMFLINRKRIGLNRKKARLGKSCLLADKANENSSQDLVNIQTAVDPSNVPK